jgi:hypothetical protein
LNSNSTAKRIRVEIIIPLRYSNGKLIEISKHKETKDEIIERFGQGRFLLPLRGIGKIIVIKTESISILIQVFS